MKELQRMNYLYEDKEICCQSHFWWRLNQCMSNERPMYFSNGNFCSIKTLFEDHESNSFEWTSTTLFETLDECCRERFWWDIDGCLEGSPKKITFEFSVNIQGLGQPQFCQDADRIANGLEAPASVGFFGDTNAFVQSLGCVDMTRTVTYDSHGYGGVVDGGLTDCRGCLADDPTFLGQGNANTRGEDYHNVPQTVATSSVFSVHHVGTKCSDDACFQDLYDDLVREFTEFVNSGRFATEVQSWARNDADPPISELFDVGVEASSLTFWGLTTPWRLPAGNSGSTDAWYPDWREEIAACRNDEKHPPYMDDNPGDYLFDSREECCAVWFAFGDCLDSSDTSSAEEMYYPDWVGLTCGKKSEFEPWEDERYETLDECCSTKFWYSEQSCCSTPGLGGCLDTTPAVAAPEVGDLRYLPDWSAEKCSSVSSSSLASWEVAYAQASAQSCCSTHFSWEVGRCCERSGGC